MLVKTIKICLLFLLLGSLNSCNEDEPNVSSEPSISIIENVLSLPGETFTITGLISDPAGIKSVQLIYDPWFLDQEISVSSGTTQYELNYTFTVPSTETEGSSHTIEVIATNGGGKSTTSQVEVSLTDDITPPVISFDSPEDGGTYISGAGAEFNLNFTVTDNTEISSVKIVGAGFNQEVDVNAPSYTFNQEVDFAVIGSHTIMVTAFDSFGNTSTATLGVTIEGSLKFGKMYLVDVSSEADLSTDVFGVPLRMNNIDHPDSLGLFFRANYYNKAANTEIRFIPQKESFGPFSFGGGSNAGELTLGDDDTVNPIILTEVGYYNILMNVSKMEYTMEIYTPTDEPYDFIQIMGTGVEVSGQSTCLNNNDGSSQCWHFASGKDLTVDPNNPYLFTATVELFDQPDTDGNNGFILGASRDGWAPFWRFDAEDTEVAVPGGGDNFVFTSEDFGTYTFEFDTHTNRARVIPQ